MSDVEGDPWRVWFKPHRPAREPWSIVADAGTEREALLASFLERREGDVLVLRHGQDPNRPKRLESEDGRGRHRRDGRADPGDPVAVIRGRRREWR